MTATPPSDRLEAKDASPNGPRPGNGSGAPVPRADALARPEASDRLLLDALATGDHAALSSLYECWFPRALALARTLTRRDESFCLDVVQETFVRIINNAPRLARLAGRDDLDRWMAAVVRSAAIDLLRRDLRRAAREAATPPPIRHEGQTPQPHHIVELLREQIGVLHGDDQELLYLRFGRGATLDGAARAVGTTIGAAYGRIRRSLRTLRKNLQEVDHE